MSFDYDGEEDLEEEDAPFAFESVLVLNYTGEEETEEEGLFFLGTENLRWSLGDRQARLDYGFPTVYVEVNTQSMPAGAFPEGDFFYSRLKEFPELNESSLSTRYGISGFQAVTLELLNADGLFNSLDLQDACVRVFLVDAGGAVREFKGRVSEWTHSFTCVATVEDVDALVLSGNLPRRTLNDIAEAEKLANPGFAPVADDLGKPVSVIFGRAVAVPLLLLKADDLNREYDYVIGEGQGLSGWFEEVFNVYWIEEALDDIEGIAAGGSAGTLTLETSDRRPQSWYKYWWVKIVSGTGAGGPARATTAYDSALNRVDVSPNFSPSPSAGSGYELTEYLFFDGSQASPYPGVAFLRFKKRLGTNGRNAQLFADVNGLQAEVNPARAIQSVLANIVWGLGLEVDEGSFDAAAALLDDLKCDGAIIKETGVTDVVNELLAFRDMVLSKTDYIKIEVDQAKTAAHSFGLGDEGGLNNIMTEEPAIRHLHTEQRVKNLKVRYRKNHREQDTYLHELARVSSQSGVDQTIALPFVYEHETADRWLDYKRKRLEAAARQMSLEVGTEGRNVRRGELVTIQIPSLGLVDSNWEVVGCAVSPVGENALDLVPYAPSAYTYLPITDDGGELPEDASFDIAPNYEKTPPNPVSNALVSYTTDLSPEGQRQVYAVVTFTPPEDNFDRAVVSIRKNGATNWETAGSGTSRVRIPVTAGFFMDYQIVAYNVYGLPSLVATLISNSLVPGDTTAPAVPTGLDGSVKLFEAEWWWNKNAEPDLAGYDYEIRTAASTAGQQAGNGSIVSGGSGFTSDNKVKFKLQDGDLTTQVTRHLRIRAIDHTAKATGAASNKSLWTATFPLSSGDVRRLDARNEDFNMPRSYENDGAISIGGGAWVEIASVTADVVSGQRVFIHGTFRYLKSGGSLSSYWYRVTRTIGASTQTVYGEGNPSGFGVFANQSQPVSFSFGDVPGNGNVTYKMYAAGGGGDQASFRRLAMNQMKR